MSLTFELAGEPQSSYETVDLSDPTHPRVRQKPQRRRRFFWWLKGGFGKPNKFDELETLHRKFEFPQDVFKPLGILFYPQGPGSCDHTKVDRAINLLTTLPFFGIAWHTYRERKTAEGKLWGASLAGVGLGSAAFHSASGDLRPWARKLDYFSIALSSIAMVRSAFPGDHRRSTALALAVTPVNPLAVSTVNAIAMESQFWRRAQKNEALKRDHRIHLGSCVLGALCFAVEEVYPHWTVIHSTWHCLSALSVATTNYLLADVEAERGLRGPRPTSQGALPPKP